MSISDLRLEDPGIKEMSYEDIQEESVPGWENSQCK